MTCLALCQTAIAAIVTPSGNFAWRPRRLTAPHYKHLMTLFAPKMRPAHTATSCKFARETETCLPRRVSLFAASVWCIACIAALFSPLMSEAALTTRDQATESLERRVTDDPRAAIADSEKWQAQAANGDKALQLRALRLMAMALAQMEDSARLAKIAEQGLTLARELRDAEAECEFLTAKGVGLSEAGKYLDAMPVFDTAIGVAERAELPRAATGAMVSKAFVFGLLGRNADALDLLFKAHQRYLELADLRSARITLSAIGNAHAHDHASRDDLLKALDYHQRSIAPDAEKNSRHELATVYYNMSLAHGRLKNLPMADSYVRKSIDQYRALNDSIGVAFGAYRQGIIAIEAGNWDEALRHLDGSLPELTKSGDATMIFNIHRARAKALMQLNRRRESLDALALADAIRRRINIPSLDAIYLNRAAEVFARFGDFARAYHSQLALRDAEQKSTRDARDKDTAEVQTRFEVKQKEAENELLRARERESEARRFALVLAVVLLLIVLGALAWYLYRQGIQNRRFANLALRDDLTGLPNRRSIIRFAADQLRVSRREDSRLCIGLIDIDHFKSINDECGHAVGDAVLTAFADVCSHQLRSNDRLGRYGGEEFLLVMPGSDLLQAPQVFARLRTAILSINVPGQTAGRQLTFSMGIVEANSAADDLDSLIKRADDALYRAKQGGRDRHETG